MTSVRRRGRRRSPAPLDLRQRLVDTTIDLSAMIGVAKISVVQLCEVAEVAPRTFYNNFADLTEAFFVASKQMHGELRETVQAAYDEADGAYARAAGCVDALIDFVQADLLRAEALFVQGPAGGPAVERLRRETTAWATALVVGRPVDEWSASAYAPPKGRDTTHGLLAEMAVGGVGEVVHQRVLSGNADELSNMTAEFVEVLMRPYEWATDAWETR